MPIDKLDGKNYSTWASDVKLWLESQGYLDHLTLKVTDVDPTVFPRWKRIDAYLCMVLKNTIHASLKPLFHAYNTSYEVWEHAKLLYTNDTQRLYGVCHDLLNVVDSCTQDPMADYVAKVTDLFHEFNEVLPLASTPVEEIEQRSRFFMVVMLHRLVEKYSHVCDQILGSTIIPNFTSTCSTLLCVPYQPSADPPIHVNDSSTLVSHRDDRHCSRKPKKGRHKCDHCGKFGHKIDRCYHLHGRPPRSAVIAHTDPPSQPSSANSHSFVSATNKSADGGVVRYRHKDFKAIDGIMPKTLKEISD